MFGLQMPQYGWKYGRPSVTEYDMHYARASVMKCEYRAYVCKYGHMFVMSVLGWFMGSDVLQTIYH